MKYGGSDPALKLNHITMQSRRKWKGKRILLQKGETLVMSNVVRNHKDNVFCMLYRDKKHLLSLYNAINGTSYEDETELEVVTLEGAFCLKMKNDAAFVVDSRLNLYEQQSSANPNMPLRDLYYVAEELRRIAPPNTLHRSTKVKIPAPRFITFYNGMAKQQKRQVYKLSELFSVEEKEPELELKVTVININPGCNDELLEKCESLRGYMAFVEKVRTNRADGMKLNDAVNHAVENCIKEDILAEFFRENREEIVEMWWEYEFDQEVYDRVLREDGFELGRVDGLKDGEATGLAKGSRIYRQIQAGNADSKSIAKACGYSTEEVERIRVMFGF